MNMIDIPVWLFGVLIATNFFVDLALFLFIYFIAGIHDLFFVRYRKEEKSIDCPYEIETPSDKENQ